MSGEKAPQRPLSPSDAPEVKHAILDAEDREQVAQELGFDSPADALAWTVEELEEQSEAIESKVDEEKHISDVSDLRKRVYTLEKQAQSEIGRAKREEVALKMALAKAEMNGGKWRMPTTDVAVELEVSQRSAQNYLKAVAGRASGVNYRQLGGKYEGVNQKGLVVNLDKYDGEFADEFSVE